MEACRKFGRASEAFEGKDGGGVKESENEEETDQSQVPRDISPQSFGSLRGPCILLSVNGMCGLDLPVACAHIFMIRGRFDSSV